jgi:hypothetical protein
VDQSVDVMWIISEALFHGSSDPAQLYQNYEGQKVFILMVQTELIHSIFRFGKFSGFSLTIITF